MLSGAHCYRNSHQRCSMKKGVLRNFAKFTYARTSFLIELQTEACNFVNKETLVQLFYCEFCEISKKTLFTEHVWATASVYSVITSRFPRPTTVIAIKLNTFYLRIKRAWSIYLVIKEKTNNIFKVKIFRLLPLSIQSFFVQIINI